MKAQQRRILLTACIMFLLSGSVFAEAPPDVEWQQSYEAIDCDMGIWVEQTRDGGYILATRDAYLIKTNAAGVLQWQESFGDEMYNDTFSCVKQTLDGGYIIAGSKFNTSTTAKEVWLIKTNAAGTLLWERTFGDSCDSHGYSVQQTKDGGYIVAGSISDCSNDDMYLIKTDGAGSTQWTKTFGGSGDDRGYSVQQTGDGGYILAGTKYIESPVEWIDVTAPPYYQEGCAAGGTWWIGDSWYYPNLPYGGWTIRDTTSGAWQAIEDNYDVEETLVYGSFDAEASGLDCGECEDEDCNFTQGASYSGIADSIGCEDADGYWEDPGFSGNITSIKIHVTPKSGGGGTVGKHYPYLVKTDASGNQQWNKSYGEGGYYIGAKAVRQTRDGGYILTSAPFAYNTIGPLNLIKTNASGAMQWQKSMGEGNIISGNSVQQTSDGGYLVSGYAYVAGMNPFYAIKTDIAGSIRWRKNFSYTFFEEPKCVQPTADGGYIIGGYESSFAGLMKLKGVFAADEPKIKVLNTGTGNSLRVEWQNDKKVKSYSVQRRIKGQTGEETWQTVGTVNNLVNNPVTKYIDTSGIVRGTEYEYRVKDTYSQWKTGDASAISTSYVLLVRGFYSEWDCNDKGLFDTNSYWEDFISSNPDRNLIRDGFTVWDVSCVKNSATVPCDPPPCNDNMSMINGNCSIEHNAQSLVGIVKNILDTQVDLTDVSPEEPLKFQVICHSMGSPITKLFAELWNNRDKAKYPAEIENVIILAGAHGPWRKWTGPSVLDKLTGNATIEATKSLNRNNIARLNKRFNSHKSELSHIKFHRAAGMPPFEHIPDRETGNLLFTLTGLHTFSETGEIDNDGGPYLLGALYGVIADKVWNDMKKDAQQACSQAPARCFLYTDATKDQYCFYPAEGEITYQPQKLSHNAMKYAPSVYSGFVQRILKGESVASTTCTEYRSNYRTFRTPCPCPPSSGENKFMAMRRNEQMAGEGDNATLLHELPSKTGIVLPSETAEVQYAVDIMDNSTFFVFWKEGDIEFTLVDPDNNTITPAIAETDPDIDYTYDDTGAVQIAKYDIIGAQPGIWTLKIRGVSVASKGEEFITGGFVHSALTFTAYTSLGAAQGEPVIIRAELQSGETPVLDALVKAIISDPDNQTDNMTLYDDGLHYDDASGDGIYANQWSGSTLTGNYNVSVTATGLSPLGEVFERQDGAGFQVFTQSAVIAGNYSDAGIDNDTDGRYEALQIGVDIDVVSPGKVSLRAGLADQSGNVISGASWSGGFTATGTYRINFLFPGNAIWESRADGPYYLKDVYLYNDNETPPALMESEFDAYETTGAYVYSAFAFNDRDSDGLSDNREINVIKTDETLADSDLDGLTDFDEIAYDGDNSTYTEGRDTNPLKPDTDNDTFSDGIEVMLATNPLDPDLKPADIDNDHVPDLMDNCPEAANTDQKDTDNDSIGDVCDEPQCGNGVIESGEQCEQGSDCDEGYECVACQCQERTLIALSSFTAEGQRRRVVLRWSTDSEIDNAGFNLYRTESENGDYVKINTSLIPAKGSPTQSASYEFVDRDVKLWKTYFYKLEDIDFSGKTTMHGPVSATPRLFR